jgi:hypothetical protein
MNTQRVEETAEQFEVRHAIEHPEQQIESGREVWAADEVPFLVALEVVKREMVKRAETLDLWDDLAFEVKRAVYPERSITCKWRVWDSSDTNSYFGDTIDEAMAKLPNENQLKAERIAKLNADAEKIRAELATLEKESA